MGSGATRPGTSHGSSRLITKALDATVVIPCRNEAHSIGQVLDAVLDQTRLPRQVVVVDDRSTDATSGVVRAWATRHPELPLQLIPGEGRGAGAAMNAGIAAAASDTIVRLDGHCLPSRDYIALSVETLAQPGAGVVGGIWIIRAGAKTPVARAIAAVLSHGLGSGGVAYRSGRNARIATRAVDTVPFGTFRRDTWEEVGGFDETLLRNQDYDFNYRVRLTGRRVLLNPAIVSVYSPRPTYAALARQYFDYGYWKVVMLRKFPASVIPRQILPLALVPLLLVALTWALVGKTAIPLWVPAAYLVVNLAGAAHAASRAREVRLTPLAAAALMVLQTAWSAGAWVSILRSYRHARAHTPKRGYTSPDHPDAPGPD